MNLKARMKNKRGDLPITLLVILVFLLLTTTLVSFWISRGRTSSSFANLGVFENLTSQVNEFYFYLHSGISPDAAAKMVGGDWNGVTDRLILSQEDKGKLSVVYIVPGG